MSFCLFGSEHKGLNLKKYGHLDGKMMRKPWHFGEGAPDPPSHTGAQGGAKGELCQTVHPKKVDWMNIKGFFGAFWVV